MVFLDRLLFLDGGLPGQIQGQWEEFVQETNFAGQIWQSKAKFVQ
ncbi:hypothetical protein [Evansella clarkii]|nr:hypothetical protein [Evansella clarkii]